MATKDTKDTKGNIKPDPSWGGKRDIVRRRETLIPKYSCMTGLQDDGR